MIDAEDIKQVEFGQIGTLGKSCVMVGQIYKMDEATLNEDGLFTANVWFRSTGQYIDNIPIVYNCENGLKDQPFTDYKREKVLVLNREGKQNPTASDLTIVGFADGIPRYCKKYLYIITGIGLTFHSGTSARRCFVWDIEGRCFAKIRNGKDGPFINFPCDPDQEDMKAWLEQRTSHGEHLWKQSEAGERLGVCGQASMPGGDILPCEKNGLEDIETDSYKFYPAWATGYSNGHGDPSWCSNSIFCPTVVSMAGTFIDEYSAAGSIYARVELEENLTDIVDGTVQVFTHLNERSNGEEEGLGKFSYTVDWQECAGWYARISTNIPRFISSFGYSGLSNTVIVQIIGVTVSTMDIIENCTGTDSIYNYYIKHCFVAQVNSFPEGTKGVDLTALTRCLPLEDAMSEAFDIAYDEIVVGHANEHAVTWWTPSVQVDFLGGGD